MQRRQTLSVMLNKCWLMQISENIERIRKDRQENQSALINERKKIEKEIKGVRLKINTHLDKFQGELMSELYAAEEKASKEMNKILTSLEQKEKEIRENQTNLASIKQHASELQTFLAMKQIQSDVEDKDKYLQSLVDNKSLDYISLSCKVDAFLLTFAASFHSFGEVKIESKKSDLKIIRQKNKEAQIMVPIISTRSIDNIRLLKKQTIITGITGFTTGCLLLSGGKTAFVEYSRCVKVFNAEGSQDFQISCIDSTFDVAQIDDNTVAFTTGDGSKRPIPIFDLQNRKVKRQIQINSESDGVALKDESLIYCARDKGLRMINLTDNSITDISSRELSPWAYLASLADRLYYTNRHRHTVSCIDLNDTIQWEFKNESVLYYPRGIAVDNNGNVFVVGFRTNNVVVISPDGQRHRQLLSREDGLESPVSLYYDRSAQELLVANSENKAFLFTFTNP